MMKPKPIVDMKVEVKDLLISDQYLLELYREGNRCTLTVGDEILLQNEDGINLGMPEEIYDDLQNTTMQFKLDCIYLWLTKDGKDSSVSTSKFDEPILFVVDCLEMEGEDLRDRPLIERKVEAQAICRGHGWTYEALSSIRLLPFYTIKNELFDAAQAGGFKGVVFKEVNSKYEDGVSDKWPMLIFDSNQEVITEDLNSKED